MESWLYIIGNIVTLMVAFGGILLNSFIQNRRSSKKEKEQINTNARILIRDVIANSRNLATSTNTHFRWLYEGTILNAQASLVFNEIRNTNVDTVQQSRVLLATTLLDSQLYFHNTNITQHLDAIEQDMKALPEFCSQLNSEQLLGLVPDDIEKLLSDLSPLIERIYEDSTALQIAAIKLLAHTIKGA